MRSPVSGVNLLSLLKSLFTVNDKGYFFEGGGVSEHFFFPYLYMKNSQHVSVAFTIHYITKSEFITVDAGVFQPGSILDLKPSDLGQ